MTRRRRLLIVKTVADVDVAVTAQELRVEPVNDLDRTCLACPHQDGIAFRERDPFGVDTLDYAAYVSDQRVEPPMLQNCCPCSEQRRNQSVRVPVAQPSGDTQLWKLGRCTAPSPTHS